MIKYLSLSIIPIILFIIITYGMVKEKRVYEWFVEGAKDGLGVCVRIFPYLLAMVVGVKIFREAGLIDILNFLLSPITGLIGLPKEILPLILIKPLSGSGAIGVFTDILKTYGVDNYIGLVSSVIMGTTETIFYTITVYFGAVRIKKIRHTLWAAIMADLTAIIMALIIVKIIL